MYTFDVIENNWFPTDDYYENTLVVSESEGDNIDIILDNIKNLVLEYRVGGMDKGVQAVNEDAYAKLMSKINSEIHGLPPSEYVANKVGYTYSSDESFYDATEIEIEIPYKGIQKGIIRISNHDVDLNKWAENNKKYDFGISFVIKETTNEWQGNNIVEVPNRDIIICEFTYKTNRNNFSFLNKLTAEIINIKTSKKFLSDSTIISKHVKYVTNTSLMEKIIDAIGKGIRNVIK